MLDAAEGKAAKYVELEHFHSNLPASATIYKTLNARHDGRCKEFCDQDNSCEGIQFVPVTNKCQLLTHKDSGRTQRPSPSSSAVKSAKDYVRQVVAQATRSAQAAAKARVVQK